MNMISSSSELGQTKSPLAELSDKYDILPKDELNRPIEMCKYEGFRLPVSEGQWTGERGNSVWKPNWDYTPSVYNPGSKTWETILKENNIDGIPFNHGQADFSEVSQATVKIDNFSEYRDANFYQADAALAKERGCSVSEIANWRDDNDLTWHECYDCKTMLVVPSEVHTNIAHTGGVSRIKELNSVNNG